MRKIVRLGTLLVSGVVCISESAWSGMETLSVTASRQESSLITATSSIELIDEDQLRLISPAHVTEALVRVSGANFSRGNGQEYLPALRSPVLSGAGACGGLLTAIDGIAISAAGFCNINELFHANIDQAEKIEVFKGPGSALYGSNSLHGIINVITAQVAEKSGGTSVLEFGENDFYKTKFSHSIRDDGQGFRADVALSRDGGFRDESGFDQQKVNLRHEYQGNTIKVTTTFGFNNLNQETAGYIVGLESYKDKNLVKSNPNPEAYRDVRSARASAQIELEQDNGSHLLLTPYFRYSDMSLLQHFLPGNPLEENEHRSIGLQSTYYVSMSDNLSWISGLDIEYTQGELIQTQVQPVSAFFQSTIPMGKHYDYQVKATMLAPFSELTWLATERSSFKLGLRYEYMIYDYDNRMPDGRTDELGQACSGGCRYSRPADDTNRFTNVSPKLGFLHKLDDGFQFYANVSHGFRVPQATELYRLSREQTIADLDSVEANSFELGIRKREEKYSYDLALYHMRKSHVIFRDADFYNISDGKTEHQGVDISGSYQISNTWYADLAASFSRHRYISNQNLNGNSIEGNDIDSAPRHFGSARLGWKVMPQATVELEWVHMGSYFTDPDNNHKYDGHDVFNLRLNWELNSQLGLYARMVNVADRRYAERADYTSFSGDRYFPGEPRSFFLGADFKW